MANEARSLKRFPACARSSPDLVSNAGRARSDWIEIVSHYNGIEQIALIADSDRRWSPRRKERIAPRLEHLPKRRIRMWTPLEAVPSAGLALSRFFLIPRLQAIRPK